MGSQAKTTKILIREQNEDFVDMTAKLTIHELEEPLEEKPEEIPEPVQEESRISEVEDSVIEDKIKQMMPDIISQIRSQVSSEMEQSRLNQTNNTQPIIEEEKSVPKKIEEPQPKMMEEPRPEEQGPVVHMGITCDGCGQENITGIRYKCAVSADFDFCETCEATKYHPYPFLKIKTLKQTPLKIFTIVNDDNNTNVEVNGHRFPVPHGF